VLTGYVECAAEGVFRWAAIEGFFGGYAGDFGVVVLFGEVREDNVACASIEDFRIGEKITDHGVGEVAGAAHHALFNVPGIGTDLEHFEIVIGFQDQEVGFAQVLFNELGKVAEIGDDGDFRAVGAESVADGIDRVVRDGEGIDLDVADLETLAGANVLEAIDGGFLAGLFGIFGVHFHDFVVRRLG